MAKYIDAEQLEKNGWFLQRNVAYTANYGYTETLKPTDYPAADVQEVRHGRWKRNNNGTYSCNLCQSWIPAEQHYYARYCLYCGAKMVEPQESEDKE